MSLHVEDLRDARGQEEGVDGRTHANVTEDGHDEEVGQESKCQQCRTDHLHHVGRRANPLLHNIAAHQQAAPPGQTAHAQAIVAAGHGGIQEGLRHA